MPSEWDVLATLKSDNAQKPCQDILQVECSRRASLENMARITTAAAAAAVVVSALVHMLP